MTYDVVAGLVAVAFVLSLIRVSRQQRRMDLLRAEAQARGVLLQTRVDVKVRYASFWSTRTVALMELVVYPGIVAVRGRFGSGRALGSEWWLRSGEASMTWVTIMGRRWLAISGPSARGTVNLALRAEDEDGLRDALAQSGVRPL